MLFLSCAAQAALPPLLCVLTVHRARRCLLRRCAPTQARMDALALGPQWRVSQHLGQWLQVLFFGLAVCGGMPGVFLLLCLFLPLFYIVDKAFLLRTCRTPPRYDGAVVTGARDALLWAVWLHWALTGWMYGAAALPSYEYGAFCGASASRWRFLAARLCKVNCLVHAAPFVALTAVLALRAHAGAATAAARAACCLPDRGGAENEHEDDTFRAARAQGRLQGLPSYDIADNPAYAPSLRMRELSPEAEPAAAAAVAGLRRGKQLRAQDTAC
jgi:hypothetical protein